MNYSRLAFAAVAAWVVDSAYGFIVYANLLGGQFAAYPGVYRAMADQRLAALFGGTLLACLALAYIYAKGYEGGSGLREGLRFGVFIALFVLGYVSITNYATLAIGRRMAGLFAVAAFIEMIVLGTTIGVVYKPVGAGPAGRRDAGV